MRGTPTALASQLHFGTERGKVVGGGGVMWRSREGPRRGVMWKGRGIMCCIDVLLTMTSRTRGS